MSQNVAHNTKSFWTPGNVLTAVILTGGLILTFLRFTKGIGAVSNLDDNNPWGIWIGFDLMCGVALAAGGYVTSATCYLFGMKHYHSAVRPAITTAFLGYSFVVVALLYDLGHPLRLPFPLVVSHGTTSLLFEVGLCVATYVTVLFIEWSPAALEWLGLRTIRNFVVKLTLPLTIMGVVLSTMHQSSLGALFLIAPGKLHPLWYSPFLPVFFFISSMVAGSSMVIFEGTLAHKSLHHMMDETHLKEARDVTLGFGKAASFILMGYFFIKVMDIAMDNDWHYLATGYGAIFLVEMFGFVLLPSFLYALGVREKNLTMIRTASVFAVLGIVVNRFNVSMVAFNWQLDSADRYFPHWMEFGISIFIVTLIITTYRFIVTRMPVLFEHSDYKDAH